MSKETELSDKAIKDMHQYHYGVERYLKFARAVIAADRELRRGDDQDLAQLHANGAKAWADVPDATAWVDELRGSDAIDTLPERVEKQATDVQMPQESVSRGFVTVRLIDAQAALAAKDAEIETLKAQLTSFSKGVKISIPTHSMEQEFQAYYRRGVASQAQALATLTAERDALQKDTERYRWLRDNSGRFDVSDKSTGSYPETWHSYNGPQFDGLIDAAIAKETAK